MLQPAYWGGHSLDVSKFQTSDEVAADLRVSVRTLRDLVLHRDTELARLPWVGNPARDWEPEPLRFMGARGIYTLYRLADRQERRSERESRIAAVADRIAGR